MSDTLLTMPTVRRIIEQRAIRTHFQPILSAKQRSIVGLEALSRAVVGVEALTRGVAQQIEQLIPPLQLFEMAQREGYAEELKLLCRENAICAFAAMPERRDDMLLFLNFDFSVTKDQTLSVRNLQQLVRSLNLSPCNVVIEFLEAKIDDLQELRWLLSNFREHGFLLALDDVGAGHSNLDRIPLIKPNIIKVDQSLVSKIDSDYHKQETLKSLVHLARKIGALVVAEGVETQDEAVVALELGADLLQGFFLGKPSNPAPLESACEKIDALAKQFKTYMVGKINKRKLQHRRFNVIMNQILCDLTHAEADRFGEILSELIDDHPSVECLYVLNEAGVQITDTICNSNVERRDNGPIFKPAPCGADHSLKEFYYILLDVELQKYTTEPYVSLASGSVCRTLSTCFRDASNSKMYILCIDVLAE